MIEIIVFFLGIAISIYLAVINHRKREAKFANIEYKCTQAIFIADEIINNIKPIHVNKRTNPVLLYQEMKLEVSPFLHSGKLANSSYAKLEIFDKNELKPNYIDLNENILAM